MNNKIKKVLNKLEENGFEAYIVGGFVRDFLMGVASTDVDICTNALPKDIINIFDIKKVPVSYGSVSLSCDEYNFDITTYRTESNYENRRPQNIEYTNNLLEDIKRRDFTINTICMNKDGKIFDYLSGQNDILNKQIKVVGDINTKFTEDPLRILRAIRFSIILDFNLDITILDFINKNKELIKNLSFTRKKEELDKIFSNKNAAKGLKLLKELDLLEALSINYDNIITVPDLLGIWAQISFDEKYPFRKNNLQVIKKIRKIISSGSITNMNLFEEDLYVIMVASQILNYDISNINDMKESLPLKTKEDLCINRKTLIDEFNILDKNNINIIYNGILEKVLNKELLNDKQIIKEYIIKTWM